MIGKRSVFNRLKQKIAQLLDRRGYTILPNWQRNTWHMAAYLRRLFRELNIDFVIDVGANRGQYHDFLRDQVGYTGSILSFEPIPDLVTELQQKAASDPAWTVKGCALGEERTTTKFNIMKNSEFSSFNNPRQDDLSRFGGANEIHRQIIVDVLTLDDVLRDILPSAGPSNIYLKLDTQGHDLQVLRGSLGSLASILALQTEASVQPIYEGMPHYDEVIRFLENQAFALSGIFPNNPEHFPLLIEFDCFLVNTRHVGRPISYSSSPSA